MQDAKEKSRAAFDRQAARYDTAYFGAHARKLYPTLLDQLEQLPRQRVLDVGCGTGELLRQMAARWPEGEYRGVDLSPEMVAIAREKLGRAALVVQGDSEHLPVPDGWAQVVVCSDSFHHYPDPEAALREFHRVLQPGGTVLIGDTTAPPLVRGIMNRLLPFSGGGDVRLYSPRELTALLERRFHSVACRKADLTSLLAQGRK